MSSTGQRKRKISSALGFCMSWPFFWHSPTSQFQLSWGWAACTTRSQLLWNHSRMRTWTWWRRRRGWYRLSGIIFSQFKSFTRWQLPMSNSVPSSPASSKATKKCICSKITSKWSLRKWKKKTKPAYFPSKTKATAMTIRSRKTTIWKN